MKYDVIVIGGGPSGMMAAGRAGELGARVLLLEKNPRLGIKLSITGKGRCNITNNTNNLKELVTNYGKDGRFLFSAFNRFGVVDVMKFFEKKGVRLKTERGNRVFPESDKSRDVLDALVDYLKESGVEVRTGQKVSKIIKKGDEIEKIILESGEKVEAKKYVITTGGKSYPATGSTGDGYIWAESLGHRIVKTQPALCPIVLEESFIRNLEGASLKNVQISVYKNNKKIDSRFGEALFTGDGMSGPIIIDMSKKIIQELGSGLELRIDFKPALTTEELDKRIQRDFSEGSKKIFKNILPNLLPKKLIDIFIQLSGIDPDKKVNLITRKERKMLLKLLKEFRLKIIGTAGYNMAVITAGGVDLKEVDSRTMNSKIVPNLYFAGEVLNLDGPTGGYNLQICWSTGYVAGESAAR